ncbi:MAG TPA: complex I NDUFA9 subunit family protein [Meiothermus sp.]|jgi:NADH dehydrogenase|nr:complex I NDUFA9 subunit family protein [Meiothermus sp.]
MNVLVVGGTGFVGTHLARRLLQQGHRVQVLSRRATGSVGGARYIRGNAATGEGLAPAMKDAEAVIYLVAIIRERGDQTFRQAIVEGTRNTLEAARAAGIRRYLHMSALGTARGTGSRYFEAKAEAEELVRASGLDWTIFRPSLIFGEGDDFFGGVLRGLVRGGTQNGLWYPPAPVIPQIGDGRFPFRPVWVGDVAEAFAQALEKPQTIGQTYPLVGPQEYTFRELILRVRDRLGSRKPLLPIPIFLMDLAVPWLSRIPGFPLTMDQYRMLKVGNTADPQAMRQDFDLEWRSLETELPIILGNPGKSSSFEIE